jgi:hypothetical protein
MILRFLKNSIKRLVALVAGIFITPVCGYLLWDNMTSGFEKDPFVNKIWSGGLIIGLGLIIYAFTGDAKEKKEGVEQSDTTPPQP